MAEQRSGFRIRVPRLRPSVPPPRPATAATQTPARNPPVRPLPTPPPPVPTRGTAPAPPPPVPPRGTAPDPPSPVPPQGTAPTPPPAPPLVVVQTPAAAGTPSPPIRPQGVTPEPQSAPPLPAISSPSPSRTPVPKPLPKEAPASSPTPPVQSLGTVPAPPPPPPPPPPQDEHASTAPTPLQAAPPSSLSPPTSPKLKTESTPEVKNSTEIPTNNIEKGTDYALNVTPEEEKHEQTSMEGSSVHSDSESHIKEQPRIKTQKTEEIEHKNQETISTTSNIPNTSMISHPDGKNPESKSPENPKPNGPDQVLNEKPASVITLAGDNRGASMHIGSGPTKGERSIHIYRRYKVNPDDTTDTTTDGEEKESDLEPGQNHEKNAYINCNIQEINNSVVFNCSFTDRNPGVHLGSCNQENMKPPKRKYLKSTDLNRVKVNITPSQKHTVRRRCLKGLFMESSDSDPNDPQKPRRHGCRYVCEDKTNKEDNIDVT